MCVCLSSWQPSLLLRLFIEFEFLLGAREWATYYSRCVRLWSAVQGGGSSSPEIDKPVNVVAVAAASARKKEEQKERQGQREEADKQRRTRRAERRERATEDGGSGDGGDGVRLGSGIEKDGTKWNGMNAYRPRARSLTY